MEETTTSSNIMSFSGSKCDFVMQAQKMSQISCLIFHAPWCRSCFRVLQLLPILAKQYPNNMFCTVDVDKAKELSKTFHINMVPSTKIIRCFDGNIEIIDEVSGSNLDLLREKLNDIALS